MIFPAKVDTWFLLCFLGGGAAMLAAAPFLLRRPRGRRDASVLFLVGLLFLGVGWSVTQVEYVLTDDGYLDASGWPFAGRIAHISQIQRVEPSRDGRASHAASLDRLRIEHGTDGWIFIAVRDKPAFLQALAAHDPGLVATGDGLRREPVGR